jgi:transcriptional regulator with XRE-family HTH domain
MTFNESLSGEIRAAMARQGITQLDLATRAGMSQSYLSRRLTRSTPFTTDDLEQIAKALGIPLTELTSVRAAS